MGHESVSRYSLIANLYAYFKSLIQYRYRLTVIPSGCINVSLEH